MRNVHKMTFDFCAFGNKWRTRTTVLAGHVDSADVWVSAQCAVMGTSDAPLLKRDTCNSSVMTLPTYPQRQHLSDEIGKQTCESSFGTHPHRPNAENML